MYDEADALKGKRAKQQCGEKRPRLVGHDVIVEQQEVIRPDGIAEEGAKCWMSGRHPRVTVFPPPKIKTFRIFLHSTHERSFRFDVVASSRVAIYGSVSSATEEEHPLLGRLFVDY